MTRRNALPAVTRIFYWFLAASLLAATLPLRPPLAHAAGPWYVAPGGNDGNSCLSAGSPCATINGAIGKASSADTIYVATGTYTNSTGSEVVLLNKSATLSGGWDTTFTVQSEMSTIDGEGARRGATVNNGVTASVERFVVQNGEISGEGAGEGAGDGILNDGTLTLNRVHIRQNAKGNSGGGGGIMNTGTLIISNSAVTDNGTINGCIGGIFNIGSLTLNNSTVSGNASNPIVCAPVGGIANSGGSLTLNNATVTNNINGGLWSYPPNSASLRNSLIARNTLSNGSPSDCDSTDVHISQGYNIIGAVTCTITSTVGDQFGSSSFPIDPRLGPLTSSPTYHPLLPGSPAIDAGNPAGCTDNLGNPLNSDQRGVARVGRCDIGAFEFDPNNNPITQIFLPLVQKAKPRLGINGTVTENGAPATGVSLDLRFYNGSYWSTLAITTTDADGDYFFTDIPSLGSGQRYYVRYQNTSTGGNPNRLWTWHTQSLTAYTAGSNVAIGNFDLANITLISPADNATVNVPHTFQWTPRTASPTDIYEFDLYDPYDFNPGFYPIVGYVGSYTLNSLPPGFGAGPLYVWEVWVYSPDGGFGISYETRVVFFSNTGLAARAESLDLLEQVERPDDVRRNPMPARPEVWRLQD